MLHLKNLEAQIVKALASLAGGETVHFAEEMRKMARDPRPICWHEFNYPELRAVFMEAAKQRGLVVAEEDEQERLVAYGQLREAVLEARLSAGGHEFAQWLSQNWLPKRGGRKQHVFRASVEFEGIASAILSGLRPEWIEKFGQVGEFEAMSAFELGCRKIGARHAEWEDARDVYWAFGRMRTVVSIGKRFKELHRSKKRRPGDVVSLVRDFEDIASGLICGASRARPAWSANLDMLSNVDLVEAYAGAAAECGLLVADEPPEEVRSACAGLRDAAVISSNAAALEFLAWLKEYWFGQQEDDANLSTISPSWTLEEIGVWLDEAWEDPPAWVAKYDELSVEAAVAAVRAAAASAGLRCKNEERAKGKVTLGFKKVGAAAARASRRMRRSVR